MADLFVSQRYQLEDNFGGTVKLEVNHSERKVKMIVSQDIWITQDSMFDQFRRALDLAERDLKNGGLIDV